MRSRPRGSASTRSRKHPDQRKPSLRSKKENPPGPVETPATGPTAGPLSYPDAKIVTANGASRPSAPAINPDERSGLTRGAPPSSRMSQDLPTDQRKAPHKSLLAL